MALQIPSPSIPFYVYLYCLIRITFFFHKQRENIQEKGTPVDTEKACLKAEKTSPDAPRYYKNIEKPTAERINQKDYISPGLAIEELADIFNTNHTYPSSYTKPTDHASFRE